MAFNKLTLNNMKRSSFYESMRRTLLCMRLMGFLPLSGLTSQKNNQLRYTLRSPYTIYYAFSSFGLLVMCLTSVNYLLQNSTSPNIIGNVIFYTFCLLSALVLTNIGRRWPTLLESIKILENQLPDLRKRTNVIVTLVAVFIMIAGVGEHILLLNNVLNATYACYSKNITENFFKINMPWIFDYIEFSLWKGLISEIYLIQSSFVWNCNDLLLIIISLYLAEYFIIHNEHLRRAIQQEHFGFGEFRTQYLKIVNLVNLINDHMGIILVTSVAGNMYWICIFLYFTIQYPVAVSNSIYFGFSFSYVIVRQLVLLILAARINTNALVPIHIIYQLPRSKYTIEARRYLSQVRNINIALSGMNFFYVTQTMNLTLFGTVVTYELVLFQLNQ